MKVGNFFFIPIGEHPPRTYPVNGSSLSSDNNSTRLFPETFAIVFKSNSRWAAIQATKCPVLSPVNTMVL